MLKQFYFYDLQNYYMAGEDITIEVDDSGQPELLPIGAGGVTDIPPLDFEGRGMYKPRFVGDGWVEDGEPPELTPAQPSDAERIAALENAVLQLTLEGTL